MHEIEATVSKSAIISEYRFFFILRKYKRRKPHFLNFRRLIFNFHACVLVSTFRKKHNQQLTIISKQKRVVNVAIENSNRKEADY
jgi:hypothetical protein